MNWVSHYRKSFKIISNNYRWFTFGFAGVSAIFIACSALNSLLPILLRNAANTFTSTGTVQTQFFFFAGCYAALWTSSQVLSNARGIFSAWILAKCDATLYETILARIFRYPHKKQERLDPGYVVADINRSSSSFSMVTIGVFWTILPIIIEIAIAIGVLYTIMGTAYAVLFLFSCLILTSISIYVAKSSSNIHQTLFEADNNLSSYTVERLSRVYDVKLNNTQVKEFSSGKYFLDNYVKTIRNANMHMGIRITFQGLAIGATLAFFVILSGVIYRTTLTAGDFVMVVGYITMFTMQLHLLAGTLINLQAHLVSLNDGIKYIEEEINESHFPEKNNNPYIFTLLNVSVKKENKFIFENINCQIHAGLNIISGESGSGKTTLINTLLGFEKVHSGTVHYKGNNIDEGLSEHILSEVSVAPQNPILISGTFKDNLLYGADSTTPQKLKQIVNLLGLTRANRDIDSLLSTAIDISGSGLSGGERQRIAIGRAILRGKPTMILDEPTAALDENTAKRILDWLASNIPCLIVVTHDESLKKKYGTVIDLNKSSST